MLTNNADRLGRDEGSAARLHLGAGVPHQV
jgi:hypothetical protein